MSAVEDTREARERAERLLTAVAAGDVHVSWTYRTFGQPLADPASPERTALFTHYAESLPEADQATVWELFQAGLVAVVSNAGGSPLRPGACSVVLTEEGQAVLGTPAATENGLPAVPPLLCDSTVTHGRDCPPAAVICIDSTDGMKRMLMCADCAPRYALDAASLAVARYRIDPSAPPVAVYFLPLPQAWAGDGS